MDILSADLLDWLVEEDDKQHSEDLPIHIRDHLQFRKRKRKHEHSLIFRWNARSLSVTCPLIPYFNAVLCVISSLFRYACRNDIFYFFVRFRNCKWSGMYR